MITLTSLDLLDPWFYNANNKALAKNWFDQLLHLLQEEVSGLNGQFQDLCITRRNFASVWDSRVHWNSLEGQAGQDFTSPKK